MKRLRFLCSLAVALCLTGSAISGDASKTVNIPPFTTRTLDNGLTVVLMEYHRLPLVEFVMTVGGGRSIEPDSLPGLAGLTAELLKRGTEKRSATEIADQTDFIGGRLSSDAGQDMFSVSAEFLAKDIATGLDLFSDVILHPVFSSPEVERMRAEWIADLDGIKEEPSRIASIVFTRKVYGSHPYAHSPIGTRRSLRAVTPEAVQAFYRSAFVPDNSLLVVVGDFRTEEMAASLGSVFGGWRKGTSPALPTAEPAPLSGRRVLVVRKPDVSQTQIRIGNTGVRMSDPDRPTILVANAVLGGGFTSRLVEEIRVKRSLTYGASSGFSSARLGGTYSISTFTKNSTVRTTIDVALEEVKKLREKGITPEELDRAHNYLTGSFARGLQSPGALANQLSATIFYKLAPDYLSQYVRRLYAVTREDVLRVVRRRFLHDDLLILVVTNPAETRKQLEGLGTVDEMSLDDAIE